MVVLGIPLDLGAGRRGVDMGPSALRLAQLANALIHLGHELEDLGNIEAPVLEAMKPGNDLPYADAIARTCRLASQKLSRLAPEVFPICLGGDHSVSLGTIPGSSSNRRTGVLWIDAHADLNTPSTSPSGNIHGMPLAHLLGKGDERLLDIWGGGPMIRPEDVVLIGLRSLDPGEKELVHRLEVRAFTMKEIDKRGIAEVAALALEHLKDVERLHVSFDADALDPVLAPGVGTPVPGGLSYREAHLLMELLADAEVVTSLDLVEVNPFLDIQNTTAKIVVEMTASLLGKRIL
ncbi:MAG: arginase [Trueperaceae bacterium]|nr:MAG: arginase [Trueperaceae bacterium]